MYIFFFHMQTKWIMLHLGIPFVLSCLSANQDLQEKEEAFNL